MAARPLVCDALAEHLRRAPGRPLLTMYDDHTGERVELSVATFDNWVSKLANLFVLEWGLEPDASVTVALPPHWQSAVVAVGTWAAGLVLTTRQDAGSQALVAGPEIGGPCPADFGLACSLRALGGAFATDLPAGWADFAVEVPAQPDEIVLPRAVRHDDLAWRTAVGDVAHGDLTASAHGRAAELGLEPGGRLITDLDPTGDDDLITALAAPLVSGASVVLVIGADESRRRAIADQEQATVACWGRQ